MTYTVHPDLVGKNTVGYRDLYDQFLIIKDFEDMARAIKKATKVQDFYLQDTYLLHLSKEIKHFLDSI